MPDEQTVDADEMHEEKRIVTMAAEHAQRVLAMRMTYLERNNRATLRERNRATWSAFQSRLGLPCQEYPGAGSSGELSGQSIQDGHGERSDLPTGQPATTPTGSAGRSPNEGVEGVQGSTEATTQPK